MMIKILYFIIFIILFHVTYFSNCYKLSGNDFPHVMDSKRNNNLKNILKYHSNPL